MMLLFMVVIPLAGAFLCALLGRRVRFSCDIITNVCALSLLVLSMRIASSVLGPEVIVYKLGGWLLPFGICMIADGLSSFMLVTVSLIVFMAMLYAVSYMKVYADKWKFHALSLLMLAGMNGVILSGDLFNLYIFLEVASISAYALVAFGTEAEDLEAAFKYMIMGTLASIFILLGIALIYSYTSTLNMVDISTVLSVKNNKSVVGFISVLFLAGFGLKAALVPFHAWLPDAHSSAPTPVSAVLSGVFIKALGIYALARIFFNVLGVSENLLMVLIILGVISMIVGAFLAIAQDDIKRMFAYSSISQVGYIIFALGVGTPLAILGGLFHLFNHAVFKSLLFLNAGAIERSAGTRSLAKLGGLSKKLRVTGATGIAASMSISGIPPLGGFWSKLIIIIAAVQAGYFVFALIAALVSIITLVYYLKFQTNAFLGPLDEAYRNIREASLGMKLAMIILAVICAVSGLMLTPSVLPHLRLAADALANGSAYRQVIFAIIK